MKYILISIFIVLSLNTTAQLGQVIGEMRNIKSTITSDAVFKKGKNFIQAGAGFPNLFFKASDLTATASSLFKTEKKGFITTMASYEYALRPNLGIGLMFGYSQGQFRYISNSNPNTYFGFKGTFVNVGVLSNYHIYSNKNVDVYSGAMLVYNAKKIENYSSGNTSITIPFIGTVSVFQLVAQPTAPSLLYQVSLGARVFPFKQKNIGFYAEGGYGITVIKAGLTCSF